MEFSPKLLEEVIYKLNLPKGEKITKKTACSMLSIVYNPKRLDKILVKHQEDILRDKKLRKSFRGKPLTNADKNNIVTKYLEGKSLDSIYRNTYRSMSIIKGVLEEYAIPLRKADHSYWNATLLPETSLEEDNYTKGDLVVSARYNCCARVEKELPKSKDGTRNYLVWLLSSHSKYACQPFFELGSLKKATTELGITI